MNEWRTKVCIKIAWHLTNREQVQQKSTLTLWQPCKGHTCPIAHLIVAPPPRDWKTESTLWCYSEYPTRVLLNCLSACYHSAFSAVDLWAWFPSQTLNHRLWMIHHPLTWLLGALDALCGRFVSDSRRAPTSFRWPGWPVAPVQRQDTSFRSHWNQGRSEKIIAGGVWRFGFRVEFPLILAAFFYIFIWCELPPKRNPHFTVKLKGKHIFTVDIKQTDFNGIIKSWVLNPDTH